MPILPSIVKAVFDADNNPIRFERFCLDIYSEAEGVELVPTSRTRDLGRDGRTISIAGRELQAVLCATLETDIDTKVKSDIRRLSETTQTRAIVYCSSKPLTEEKCSKIEAEIRQSYPSIDSVHVLGQIQLVSLAERHENVLRRHYVAEIQNIEEALLLRAPASPAASDIGLRLALITQVGDDATLLRKELATRLVLDTLLDQKPKTPGQLAVTITAQLHLPRALSANYIGELLKQLANDGLVSIENSKAQLTSSGIKTAKTIPEEAGAKLLEGRLAVREAIKTLSGHTLHDSEFKLLWDTFQDGIAELFYYHGLAIVRMIRSVLAEETPSLEKGARAFPIENLAERVASLLQQSPHRDEIRQAIIDMFSEKDSAAFQWLTQICGVYVMMCSLGFETLSSQQIINVLSGFRLAPDSDVLISLLCEGEENHDDVLRIFLGWRALGGKLLLARPVLEEVAYHAWISKSDYAAFEHNLARLSDAEARHLIENAFVRAFRKVAGDLTSKKYWHRYISQYRGRSEWDYTSIMDHLRDEHGFGLLPEAGEEYKGFAKAVMAFLIKRASEDAKCKPEDLDYRTRDKATRDGRLIAAVVESRQLSRQAAEPGRICIVSSAKLLKEADEVFHDDLGQPDAVLSAAAIGFLLTLTPQVPMGFSTLRSVLFDTHLAARLTPAQRYAYRMIASSEEWDFPLWARRGTLHRELGQILLAQARARGEPVRQVRDRVLRTDNPEYSAQVVVAALDKMAIHPKSRAEISELKAEVEKLRKELEAVRQSRKATPIAHRGKPPRMRRRQR